MEKSTGSRLRRLTYLLLGVFTLAFIALFFWLNQVTSTLAINSVKDQMLALVETGVSFINGDDFEAFIKAFPADNRRVHEDEYYQNLETVLDDIKDANKNIKTQMALYIIIKGDQADEIKFVASTVKEIIYGSSFYSDNMDTARFAGLDKTTADTTIIRDANGSWISACSPIFKSNGQSAGALCADFNAGLLEDTRKRVATTLGIAFVAIYPAMIILVLLATGSFRKIRSSVTKK